MGDVVALVALNAFKKYTASARPDNNIQTAFKPHEKRTIGDIRTHLMDIGFTKNPTPKFSAYPDQEQQNNRITLEIDVADPKYQKIFGERFKITITKYKTNKTKIYSSWKHRLTNPLGTLDTSFVSSNILLRQICGQNIHYQKLLWPLYNCDYPFNN